MKFKIAIIGAGSVGFTREMVRDILSVPEFSNVNIAFTDISKTNLDMAMQLIQRDIDANGLDIKISGTLDRREAFKDAKYVLNFVRVGMLEAFETDVKIPLKYGIDQCVGDTLCIGGIMYAQRGIEEILNFCKDIREVADKNCMMLSYVNPCAMITWACNKYGGVPTIGLCHGVQNGQKLIGKAFGVEYDDLIVDCAGINHQTWYTKVLNRHTGEDLLPQLLSKMENNTEISESEKVRLDVLRKFGYFSTESNGHLSEYLAWYRKNPSEIHKYISMDKWINGESLGYLRHCSERRKWYETDFPQWLAAEPLKYSNGNKGIEHGSHIIESLETGRIYRGHFNVVNNGAILNLPNDAVVEVPGYVDLTGVKIPIYGELPIGCAAICNQSINVQRLAVEAAVSGDVNLLKQAAMMDPLTGAVLNTDEISQMVDELLIAQEKWLPQYADGIKEAKIRIKNNYIEPLKPKSQDTFKKWKTVEEIENDTEAQKMYNKAANQN